MKIDVNKYLSRCFKRGRYNCFDFAREVWAELTGRDLGHQTPATEVEYGEKAIAVAGELQTLDRPVSPCLVLLMSPRREPHVGVYYEGKVLHLNERGAYYMPLDLITVGYPSVNYYK